MRKKMMPLAIAVASLAMLILPTVASGQEDHIDGWSAFSGTIDAGSSLLLTNEPVFTCSHGSITGSVGGGGTTGSLTFDLTDCHTPNLGFTVKCHTSGSPLDNTIAFSGTFHMITLNNKPAWLVTTTTTEMNCGGIITHLEGSLIGTITSPACNVVSNTMTVKFEASGSTQNHLSYTGVNYDLKARTGSGGEQRTAGVNAVWTFASAAAGTITCT